MKRQCYLLCGWMFVVFGMIGIFLPLMPTTPFLLGAAFAFSKSSPRFYRWLTGNIYLNSYLENYRHHIGVPREIIRRSLIFLWIALLFSAALWQHSIYWMILAAVGAAVTWHLLALRRSTRAPLRFTLIELLISTGIIALLASLLLPAMSQMRQRGGIAQCSGNLRQIGLAVGMYAFDNNARIPDTDNGYWNSSIPIIRMFGGRVFALGKLMQPYRMTPASFGCPANQTRTPNDVRAMWNGRSAVQSAYIYRETDCDFQSVLDAPGNRGKAMAADFSCISSTGAPIVPHGFRSVNILYAEGHVLLRLNDAIINHLYTVMTPPGSMGVPPCDTVWQNADGSY